jgi:3',5'-cyclic AMP phosphodiesterase CpdA
MGLNFRFAVASDLHIALPQTIGTHPHRFHLVEVSIPALETALQSLEQLNLDFLLLPGDLTQDGEQDNHQWLQQRLASLPFPVYVVPGNHDVLQVQATEQSIAVKDFPYYYQEFGYKNPGRLYYTCEVLPGVQLIALNSNQFDEQGKQVGFGGLDEEQLTWLERVLAEYRNKLVLVMVHHNAIEHLPNQAQHFLGRRYMIKNAPQLLQMLRDAEVQLLFSGHLHVQDVAYQDGVYDITTGSLVSYPHPYRVLEFEEDDRGNRELRIKSYRVTQVAGWEDLPSFSRELIADRSYPFMMKLATSPPVNLPVVEAERIAARLRYFWADIAGGDAIFEFPDFPPEVRQYFEAFSAVTSEGIPALVDNQVTLRL